MVIVSITPNASSTCSGGPITVVTTGTRCLR
jgi:hypothetical protein